MSNEIQNVDTLAEKLLPSEIQDATAIQRAEDRQRMSDAIVKTITDMGQAGVVLLRESSVGGELHPNKLAKALEGYIPANWQSVIVRDDVPKTANEQLAAIAVRASRNAMVEYSRSLIVERGLTEQEQTRAVKKAIRNTAYNEVSASLPLKVATANKAERRDSVLAFLQAALQK